MKELVRKVVVWIMTLEAKMVVHKYRPHIMLVTGSVGKTSTKDALYTALSATHFVRRSEKSYNSDIGVPLTVLGVANGWGNPARWLRNIIDGFLLLVVTAPYPEWLILEVGADRPGDITTALSWLHPEVVVATRFPSVPVHVEFYDTPEDVRREELAPASWLRQGGVLVGNAEDSLVTEFEPAAGVESVLYGTGEHAQVRATKIHTLVKDGMPRGVSCDVTYLGERAHVALDGVLGMGHIYAVLAGIAGAVAIGVPLKVAAAAFQKHETPPGRMHVIPGIRKSVLIDDTYNSSPVAAEEALKTLADIPRKGRRIAVLGDMLELGAYSVAEHEKIGALAAHSADLLVTVGIRARSFGTAALGVGMHTDSVLQFDKSEIAGEHLKGVLEDGDVVLVKGSQGVRMERISKMLMANPDNAKKLLPRQDAEWLTR